MSLNNRVVLLTGAASGIGEAIATRFASTKANLSLLDINEENLNKVTEKCENFQCKVIKITTDVAKDDDLKRAVNLTLKEFGRIDVVINCAGIAGRGYIKDVNLMENFDKIVDINLRSIITLTNYTVEELIKTKGCVVNISSICSKTIYQGGIPYCVAKAGVTCFTKCVAMELAKHGVRANCISPGPLKTNIWLSNDSKIEDYDKFWERLDNISPLKDVIKIEDIAEMAFFLASDNAKSITGSDFVIDAGFSLLGWGTK